MYTNIFLDCNASNANSQLFLAIQNGHLFFVWGRTRRIIGESKADVIKWEEDVNPYNLQTLAKFSKYHESQVPELDINNEIPDQKMKELTAKVSRSNSGK